MTTDGLLAYCRPGFEPELAAELTERATQLNMPGYARTQSNSGYVEFHVENAGALSTSLPLSKLIFARQKLRLLAELKGLNPKDRIAPIFDALAGRGRYGDLWMEHPDSDLAKPLAGLARSFGNALRPALRQRGLLTEKEDPRLPRLHVCFIAGDHALLASSDVHDSSPWLLGVPRLRQLSEAPSRSALKLEEALLTLLSSEERTHLIKPGMSAADLGAAPGGWSWVMARQHIRILAIDNGALAESAIASGIVEHIRADGFSWRPPKPQDWLLCDMVESPRRVTSRMAEWFAHGWCEYAIFNLKLPMKKRWDETQYCLENFAEQAGKALTIRARQLYHDREEITVFASNPAAKSRAL